LLTAPVDLEAIKKLILYTEAVLTVPSSVRDRDGWSARVQ
jgi:hypothetical protein